MKGDMDILKFVGPEDVEDEAEREEIMHLMGGGGEFGNTGDGDDEEEEEGGDKDGE